MAKKIDLTTDHKRLKDDLAARRYFAKFARITRHLGAVAQEMEAEGDLSRADTQIISEYIAAAVRTFRTLSLKYLVSGRLDTAMAKHLTIDLHESGFPIFQELATMALDAAQADQNLSALASPSVLKDEMIREIVGERRVPTRLQYAMSQRLYYEALSEGGLFWPQLHPVALWRGDLAERRRLYTIHWGVYDSQTNLPMVYILDLEDSGKRALAQDERRWPAASAHLMAQSVGGLKLVTIAGGFDSDFDDLHPVRLRRIHIGPMHSRTFTLQSGPIKAVLDEANAHEGEDWALAWTVEELIADRVQDEKASGLGGIFGGTVERTIYRLNARDGAETGTTRISRSLILPQRPYQVLAERQPAGFRDIRKFVIVPTGRVIAYS